MLLTGFTVTQPVGTVIYYEITSALFNNHSSFKIIVTKKVEYLHKFFEHTWKLGFYLEQRIYKVFICKNTKQSQTIIDNNLW